MEYPAIIALLAIVQYFYFGMGVSRARIREGVKAPAIQGGETFERHFRVQQNTLEVLIMLLPALWIFSHYVSPTWGAGLGAVYLVGRFLYASAYVRRPASRGLGFGLSMAPIAVLILGGLVGAVLSLVR